MIDKILKFHSERRIFHYDTWKIKDFNEKKLKKEAANIFCFMLELVNFASEDFEPPIIACEQVWARIWDLKKTHLENYESTERTLINVITRDGFSISTSRMGDILYVLIALFKEQGVTKEELIENYIKKHKKLKRKLQKQLEEEENEKF